MTIHAIYENGVFRPTEPVSIPDNSPVLLHAQLDLKTLEQDKLDNAAIWKVLANSVDTEDPFLSERHNEHQP